MDLKIYGKVGITYMRDFYKFMRHFQLINWRIVVHSINELKCIAKGDDLKPSFNPDTIPEYIEDLKEGIVRDLPMGAYEYNSCVEYLKMIRRKLWENRRNFESFTLVFSKLDCYNLLIAPVEDCLEMVAKEVGFKIVSETDTGVSYNYVLKSEL